MTAVIGIHCEDGAVIGTDSSSTYYHIDRPTIEQPTKKIHIIGNNIIIAETGSIGLGQRFQGIVQEAYNKKIFSKSPYREVGRCLSEFTIKNFASTKCEKGLYGALLAYSAGRNVYLCEFDVKYFQPEWKSNNIWHVSIGSGQPITDPFLGFMRRIFFPKGSTPKVTDAIFMATWALRQAIDLNPGGIKGPINIATLRVLPGRGSCEVYELSNDDILEHMNNVKQVEEYIGKWQRYLKGEEGISIPSFEE